MRRGRLPLAALLLLVCGVPPIAAQTASSPSGEPVSLRQVLADVLERNPELAALRRELDARRIQPAIERSLMPPMLEGQIWQWPIDTIDPGKADMFMVMLEQELPGPGKRQARANVAEKEADVAEAAIAVKAVEVLQEARRAWADLYLARASRAVYEDNLAIVRQLAESSEAKYATGRISQQDVLKPVVELSALHERLVMLEEQEAMAIARLNALADRPPHTPIGPLADPVDDFPLPDSATLQERAIAAQPELEMAAREIASAEAQVFAARRETRPDFSIQGGYMVSPMGRDAWTASVGITWPTAPWAKKGVQASIRAAEARLETAKARRRALETRVRQMVHEAWVRVRSASRRAELLRTSVLPQSQHTLDVARAAYQTDRVDFLDLLDTQRQLLDSQLDYHRALADRELAIADLERAVGQDLTSLLASGAPTASAEMP